MRVQELIAELQKLPADSEAMIATYVVEQGDFGRENIEPIKLVLFSKGNAIIRGFGS